VPILHWDASALTKRYFAEIGSDVVDALFAAVPTSHVVTTFWCYAETYASLLRKRNRGEISPQFFAAAVTLLQAEILDSPDCILLSVDDQAVLDGIPLVLRHNLNTTDAALLATCLRYTRSQAPGGPTHVLIVADQRLLRAASAEGLATLNPEAVAAVDVPTLLAAW
jgi:predicted nucleic acid-binding protein